MHHPIRIACVGDSLTYGFSLENREKDCYPSQLQLLLGSDYIVMNYGHSGASLLFSGNTPYISCREYQYALQFKADIVVICLGTNDTSPGSFNEHMEDFKNDYTELINQFRKSSPSSKIYISLIPPIFLQNKEQIVFIHKIEGLMHNTIADVAKSSKSNLIDLFTPLANHPEFFSDSAHPNTKGARIIADTVCASITAKNND